MTILRLIDNASKTKKGEALYPRGEPRPDTGLPNKLSRDKEGKNPDHLLVRVATQTLWQYDRVDHVNHAI